MRLVIATPLYPPEPGGPATYAKILEDGLAAHGIEVAAVVKFSEVRRLPRLFRHMAYEGNVRNALKKADAVLALDPVSVGLPAMRAAQKLKKPFFVKIVGDYAWEQGTQRFGITASLDEFVKAKEAPLPVKILRRIQTDVATAAARIIVPSEYLKSIVAAWGVPAARIDVIHNAVSVGERGAVPDAIAALPRPLVVSVGRLVPWKGMNGLIDAVRKVRETLPVSLAIIGSGPEQEALTRHAHQVLDGAGIVAGQLSHEDTLAVMESADVFALNTSYEGLSHLLIEALALGKAIITTPVGGNTELITHGENGMLVGVGNCRSLSEGLHAMLADAPLRARLEQAARESSKRFSVETLLAKTSAVLSSNI